MNALEKLREQVEKIAGRFRGRKELMAHLSGQRLSMRQIIVAKCCSCMGYYSDGPADCKIPSCPCYQIMPYREERPEKRRKADLTDEQRAEIAERMKKARESRAADRL